MFDTHTHLYLPNFENEEHGAIDRALEAGVGTMMFPAVGLDSIEPMMRVASRYPGKILLGMGLHPSEITTDWEKDICRMREMMRGAEINAIGEVGVDYYWEADNFGIQPDAFAAQIRIAREMGLPVIIHCREALEDTLRIIATLKEEYGDSLPQMIFHSFTGSPADVKEIRKVCDAYFGINGVVTFKNSGELPEAVKEIGIERILLETDSPYLAPVPFRGRRNESAYLPAIRDKVASILGITPEECEEATDTNARKVFAKTVTVK